MWKSLSHEGIRHPGAKEAEASRQRAQSHLSLVPCLRERRSLREPGRRQPEEGFQSPHFPRDSPGCPGCSAVSSEAVRGSELLFELGVYV